MVSNKEINLTDLLVNTENYRFEPVESQKEAIANMISNQGDKLYILARHIVENGLNPNDRIQVIVSHHDKTKYNVLEGNRRVVALKLVSNADLIEGADHANLKKKFKTLNENYDGKLGELFELDCILYEDIIEANKWIKLKHAGECGGAGTVGWDSQQVQRFEQNVEGKPSIALEAIKLLGCSEVTPEEIKSNLKNIKITSLGRLLGDPEVRSFLGIQSKGGIIESLIDKNEVVKGLVQVASDLLDENFKVNDIYTKDDRKDYVKNFRKSSVPDKTQSASLWRSSDVGVGSAKSTPKASPHPTVRDRLIPKSCNLTISNPKLNKIYRNELQKMSISRYTNAVSVLFRVFVELSLDCYVEKNKLTKALTAAGSGMSLQNKVVVVTQHLEQFKKADKNICKGIRHAVKDHNGLLGIDTWHAYVHNSKFSATESGLTTTWDNIEDFIKVLWENI